MADMQKWKKRLELIIKKIETDVYDSDGDVKEDIEALLQDLYAGQDEEDDLDAE